MRATFRRKVVAAFSALLLSALFFAHSSSLRSAELLMFEHAGCPWCVMWHREIGPIYPKTEEGQRAPLRRIALTNGMPPEVSFVGPVTATPTFVLVENGKEIGRLTGYRDDDSFWGLLGVLLQKLPTAGQGEQRRVL